MTTFSWIMCLGLAVLTMIAIDMGRWAQAVFCILLFVLVAASGIVTEVLYGKR